MKLDFNYSAKTRLKNWWTQVKNNFTAIENWVNNLEGGGVSTSHLKNYSVTTEKLASEAVTTAKIADGNVTTAKIASGAVTADKLGSSAVTTAKIADGNVTTAKIASGAVTADKLGSSAVTTEKISTGAVTSDKLGSSAVTAVKISSGAVTTEKIADGNVTTAKLSSGAVTKAKLASEVTTELNNKSNTGHTHSISDVSGLQTALDSKINTTYTLTKSGSTITLTGSDGKATSVTDSSTIYSTATQNSAGLMSAADKKKLDGLTQAATSPGSAASTLGTAVNPIKITSGDIDMMVEPGYYYAWNPNTCTGTFPKEFDYPEEGFSLRVYPEGDDDFVVYQEIRYQNIVRHRYIMLNGYNDMPESGSWNTFS